ncbi:MAG: TRAP transporter small permease subunit [Betaproteobacteria bacterium]|nr:TRAP transporter small permease subunit [Betaproteobacteria bacterium]MDH4324119.1 TRAP transporter small permease subunit [Betaproteobacteria bacterium]MDH5351273.1 TRAP transporter small permease subunit [Betaproteobacteria bacterium]MDH5578090.1 TRAP transporter small permease subunit [Betaproteobacteria bacterium]
MRSLKRIADAVDAANDWIGRAFAWLTLGMVLTEFTVVLSRYVFGLGSTIMQESIVYMHATVFLVCAGYALVHNGHVRCDIFYASMTPRTRAIVDIIGTIVFLLPMCVLLGWMAWPYVKASWAVMEISQEGRLGIPAVYLLKTLILVFTGLLTLQALSLIVQSALVVVGAAPNRGRVDGEPASGGGAA